MWERSKRWGDAAPGVTLLDASREPVSLAKLWRSGPLIVVFYRGGWCSYCSQHLRAWQEHQDSLRRLDAGLVAECPQTPDHLLDMQNANGLSFPNLSDSALEAANGFEIACYLPPELVDMFAYLGTEVPVFNAGAQWVVPIPASFVIGRGGIIRFARIEADYKKRTPPAEVIRFIEEAQGR